MAEFQIVRKLKKKYFTQICFTISRLPSAFGLKPQHQTTSIPLPSSLGQSTSSSPYTTHLSSSSGGGTGKKLSTGDKAKVPSQHHVYSNPSGMVCILIFYHITIISSSHFIAMPNCPINRTRHEFDPFRQTFNNFM